MVDARNLQKTIYERHEVNVVTKPCTITSDRELMSSLKNDPDDTALIKRWIEEGDYDTSRYTELPHLHRNDRTRNIILHDNQMHMYVVLNGGRLRSMGADGKTIESVPVSATQYNQNVISTVISETGEKITYHDDSPLGGYYPASLTEKVGTTQLVGARVLAGLMSGRDAIIVVPLYTAAIAYCTDTTGDTEFAAGAYRIPSKATMSPDGEMQLEDCILMPYVMAIEQNPQIAIAGNYIADGALVALGFTHPQNHLGNRYLQADFDGKNVAFTGVLTDMEDVTDISGYSSSSHHTKSELMFENRTDFKLSPKGKAIAHMLVRAIDCDISYYLSRLRERGDIDPTAAADELIRQILDPAVSTFQLGYKLAAREATRENLAGVMRKKSLIERNIGMVMNGNVVSMHSEINRLFTVLNRYLLAARHITAKDNTLLTKIDDEITVVTRMISAIAAKDIVTTLDPAMISEDRFVSTSRLLRTTAAEVSTAVQKKPGRKRHKPRT